MSNSLRGGGMDIFCSHTIVIYHVITSLSIICFLSLLLFLTRELRMRNTSYRELWENVSLDRSIRCKLYANEVRMRLSIKLLSNLN